MSQDPPKTPDQAKDYGRGIDIFLSKLPQLLAAEQGARDTYDPTRIAQQQGLQDEFGPNMYRQQLDALNQLDPEGRAVRSNLASHVWNDLASGYQLPQEYDTQLTSNIRGAQAARGNSLGTAAAGAEASFKGKAALDLYQQHLQNAGNFLGGPTPMGQIGQIQSVQPDRSSAYTNPGAGYAGINAGQQNYQNMLAQYQLAQGQGGGWGGALGGAAQGAAAGGSSGNIWGAVAGGVIGGVGGYFCDSRLKTDIVPCGTSPSGIPLIQFSYKGFKSRFAGANAQDVQKVFPNAVTRHASGYLVVDFDKTDVKFQRL